MKFDAKRFSNSDWAIVGGAALAFLSGFLPWWGYKGTLGLYAGSIHGWSAGFTAWAGILLLSAAGVFLLLRRSEVALPKAPVGPAVLVALASGFGLLLVIIRWITLPTVPAALSGVIGVRYGIWFALIGGAVETVAAVIQMRASGEPLPWAEKSAPES